MPCRTWHARASWSPPERWDPPLRPQWERSRQPLRSRSPRRAARRRSSSCFWNMLVFLMWCSIFLCLFSVVLLMLKYFSKYPASEEELRLLLRSLTCFEISSLKPFSHGFPHYLEALEMNYTTYFWLVIGRKMTLNLASLPLPLQCNFRCQSVRSLSILSLRRALKVMVDHVGY